MIMVNYGNQHYVKSRMSWLNNLCNCALFKVELCEQTHMPKDRNAKTMYSIRLLCHKLEWKQETRPVIMISISQYVRTSLWPIFKLLVCSNSCFLFLQRAGMERIPFMKISNNHISSCLDFFSLTRYVWWIIYWTRDSSPEGESKREGVNMHLYRCTYTHIDAQYSHSHLHTHIRSRRR